MSEMAHYVTRFRSYRHNTSQTLAGVWRSPGSGGIGQRQSNPGSAKWAAQGGLEMLSKSIAPRRAALAALMITLNLAALSATASAKTLAGVWAPFNRCPVDSVAMLEANGESAIAAC